MVSWQVFTRFVGRPATTQRGPSGFDRLINTLYNQMLSR